MTRFLYKKKAKQEKLTYLKGFAILFVNKKKRE